MSTLNNATDWEKIGQLLAIATQSLMAAQNIYNNHLQQEGKTDEELGVSADEKNKRAKEMIDSL